MVSKSDSVMLQLHGEGAAGGSEVRFHFVFPGLGEDFSPAKVHLTGLSVAPSPRKGRVGLVVMTTEQNAMTTTAEDFLFLTGRLLAKRTVEAMQQQTWDRRQSSKRPTFKLDRSPDPLLTKLSVQAPPKGSYIVGSSYQHLRAIGFPKKVLKRIIPERFPVERFDPSGMWHVVNPNTTSAYPGGFYPMEPISSDNRGDRLDHYKVEFGDEWGEILPDDDAAAGGAPVRKPSKSERGGVFAKECSDPVSFGLVTLRNDKYVSHTLELDLDLREDAARLADRLNVLMTDTMRDANFPTTFEWVVNRTSGGGGGGGSAGRGLVLLRTDSSELVNLALHADETARHHLGIAGKSGIPGRGTSQETVLKTGPLSISNFMFGEVRDYPILISSSQAAINTFHTALGHYPGVGTILNPSSRLSLSGSQTMTFPSRSGRQSFSLFFLSCAGERIHFDHDLTFRATLSVLN